MSTKLFLQILLLLGCLALVIGAGEAPFGRTWIFTPEGWWRGAIAFWMLAVTIRMVYPANKK
jgi:hypothetical protein